MISGDKENTSSMAKGARLAVRCTDLTPHTWEIDDESVTTGGFVRSMAWDPLGERLAVIFKGKHAMWKCVKSYRVLKSRKQYFQVLKKSGIRLVWKMVKRQEVSKLQVLHRLKVIFSPGPVVKSFTTKFKIRYLITE